MSGFFFGIKVPFLTSENVFVPKMHQLELIPSSIYSQ
jgi:hypothetical protein